MEPRTIKISLTTFHCQVGGSKRFQASSIRREKEDKKQVRHHRRIYKFVLFPVVVILAELVVIVLFDLLFKFLPEVSFFLILTINASIDVRYLFLGPISTMEN